MADAFKQRRRTQGMQDERMDMSRDSSARAAQSFEWATANQARRDREYREQTDERAAARNAGGQMIADFESRGIQLPEHIKAPMAMAESMEQFNTLGAQAKKFVSETPMNPEAVEKYRLSLKPGEYAYVTERQPNGSLIKRTIRGEGQTTGAGMKGFTEGLNSFQRMEGAGMTLEHAKADKDAAYEKDVQSTLEGVDAKDMKRMDDTQVARAGGGPVKFPRHDSTQEDQAIEKAQAGVGYAQQDFFAQIMKNPQILQFLQMMGIDLTQGLNLTADTPPADPAGTEGEQQLTPAQAHVQRFMPKEG
jgi:hypothetical protein